MRYYTGSQWSLKSTGVMCSRPPAPGHHSSCRILHPLQPVDECRWQPVQKWVTILETGNDEGLDDCCGCFDIKDIADPADVVKMLKCRAADISDVGLHAKVLVEDSTKIACRGWAADKCVADGETTDVRLWSQRRCSQEQHNRLFIIKFELVVSHPPPDAERTSLDARDGVRSISDVKGQIQPSVVGVELDTIRPCCRAIAAMGAE